MGKMISPESWIEFYKEHHDHTKGLECDTHCKYYIPPWKDSSGCKVLDFYSYMQCQDIIAEYRKWEKATYGTCEGVR